MNIPNKHFETMAEWFKALSDPTRLQILYALLSGELSVSEIAGEAGASASAVSHQLAYLRSIRLVKNRRNGRSVYYALDDEHVRSLFEQALEHASHE